MAISFGWPLVCMMSFIVALSMAEICSGAALRIPVPCSFHKLGRSVWLSHDTTST